MTPLLFFFSFVFLVFKIFQFAVLCTQTQEYCLMQDTKPLQGSLAISYIVLGTFIFKGEGEKHQKVLNEGLLFLAP